MKYVTKVYGKSQINRDLDRDMYYEKHLIRIIKAINLPDWYMVIHRWKHGP